MNPRCWRIKPGSKTGRRTIKIQSEVGLSQCFALGKVFEKLHKKSKVQSCNSMVETPVEKVKLGWYNLETDCKNLNGRNTARKRTPHIWKKGNVAKEDAKGVADAELCDRRPVSCVDPAMTGNPRLRWPGKGGDGKGGKDLTTTGGSMEEREANKQSVLRQMEVLSGHGELSFYVMNWSFW